MNAVNADAVTSVASDMDPPVQPVTHASFLALYAAADSAAFDDDSRPIQTRAMKKGRMFECVECGCGWEKGMRFKPRCLAQIYGDRSASNRTL